MAKQILCILLIASMLTVFTACNQTKGESSIISSSTQTEAESSSTSSSVSTAGNEWVSIAQNVYDISSLVEPLTPLSVSQIFFDQRLLLTYGYKGEQYMAIPFDLKSLSLEETAALTIQEAFGGGGVTVRQNMHGDHLVFTKKDSFENKQTIRIFDPPSRTTLAEWDFSNETVVGMTKEMDRLLLMDTTEDSTVTQHLYHRDISSGQDHSFMNWTVSDPLKKPALTMVSQGDKGVAFTGLIYPSAGAQSVMCFGLIDKEGNIQTIKKLKTLDMAAFHGGIVIYDDISALGETGDSLGHFEVYNADTMTVTNVTPEMPEESSARIVVSDNGQYILTEVPLGKESCYRVYDVQENKLIAKFSFEPKRLDATEAMMQQSFISEKDRAFLVMTQSKSDIQLYYFQF